MTKTRTKAKAKRKLTPECIRRIRAMIAGIVNHPAQYTQNKFPNPNAANICETPGCAAGFAVFNDMTKKQFETFVKVTVPKAEAEEGDSFDTWCDAAAKALHLPKDLRVSYTTLFGGSNRWPYSFSNAYRDAELDSDHVRMAAACAARWEYFIATDGRES